MNFFLHAKVLKYNGIPMSHRIINYKDRMFLTSEFFKVKISFPEFEISCFQFHNFAFKYWRFMYVNTKFRAFKFYI